MKKEKLRMNEMEKYNVIKKLVETNGNKKRAAVKLNCTTRTVNRLIQRYKEFGKEGFIHGNRNRKPATAFSDQTKEFVTSLYINDFKDVNYEHFCEILEEDHHIKISSTTVNMWLRDSNVLSPKAHRKTKKAMKKLLKEQLKNTTSIKASNELKEKLETIHESQAHPRRPRCEYIGEMLQMDASEFYWIPEVKWHLHIAVDDATSAIHGAYFDTQETLNGYYHVFHQILTEYGIPCMFYTDRRTVFEYKRKDTLLDDEDTFTQFAYACKQLGVEIKTTSVAQAKGRVERMNQTLQSRLPVELRRANVKTLEQANEFLKSYIKKFNEQFALQLNTNKSVYEQQPDPEKINCILAVISERTIDSGHCAKYKNSFYMPVDSHNIRCFYPYKTKCLMIEAFGGNLYMSVNDKIYATLKIETHECQKKDSQPSTDKKPKPKKKYIPPMDHPWRYFNYTSFRNAQKHRANPN